MFAVLFMMAVFILSDAARNSLTEHSSRAVGPLSKAGLAWPTGVPWADITQYQTTGKVSWFYSWTPNYTETTLEFVPMLWGSSQVQQFSATINQTIASRKVSAVLAMNEPQQSDQSNLSPQQAAEMWKTYLEPLKAQGIRLGSPAPSSATNGKTWLLDFLAACAGGCSVDFIALHWYFVNSTLFKSYLIDFHDTFMRPLWVTEWACQNYNDVNAQCSQADVYSFMAETQSFMDSTEWVERYAWFGAMENLLGINQDNALMDVHGKINDLGRQYIGAGRASSTGTNYVVNVAFLVWTSITGVALMAMQC